MVGKPRCADPTADASHVQNLDEGEEKKVCHELSRSWSNEQRNQSSRYDTLLIALSLYKTARGLFISRVPRGTMYHTSDTKK